MAAISDQSGAARARALAHFGAALRLLRIDAGLSLRALAQRIGVSSAYLSRVEHGVDAIPTPDRLLSIAGVLGVPPALLMELGHQVDPSVVRYLERVPAASALFQEIARRNLGGPQLSRIKAFIDAEFPASVSPGARPAVRLTSLLSTERIILRLSCSDLEDAVDLAAARLAPAGGLGPSALAREILQREREASTALGGGVAVPHALIPRATPAAVLITLASRIDLATPDDVPIQLIVVLIGGEQVQPHLQMLAQVARLADHDVAEGLVASRDAAQVLKKLAQFEASCG